MNCCDRLLILFTIFAFFQYQLRWERDRDVVRSPWALVMRTGPNVTTVHPRQCVTVTYEDGHPHGSPRFAVQGSRLVSTEGVASVAVHVYMNLTAPPLSDHRVTVYANDVPVRDMTLRCSMMGTASNDMYIPSVDTSNVVVEYCFDTVWDASGPSVVRGGIALYPSYHVSFA